MRTLTLLATLITSAHADELVLHDRYFQTKNAQVQHALLRFSRVQAPQVDRVDLLRDQDRLRLFGHHDASTGYGVALFGAVTILAAHAPPFARLLFDGPVHLGPAVLENGGLGAGIGGRFYL